MTPSEILPAPSARTSWLSRLHGRLTRYRASVGDLVLIGALVAVAAFIALLFDIFETEQRLSDAQMRVDLNEVMALAVLVSIGLSVFTIRRVWEQKRELRRRLKAEHEARELAFQDPLTGLANRRSFDEALTRAMASPPGSALVHAVLMMDLNGFKRINDIFGHGAGDDVLAVVARRLSGLVRGEDLVARLGGDEFAILAHHLTGPEAALSLGLRVIECLEQPVKADGIEHAVGAGIGIALAPRDAADASEIMRKADIALYRAKTGHRSAVKFFEEDMDAQLRERNTVEQALRGALTTGALTPHYQPLVDMKSGEVVGFEALARWTDPLLGEISPERFIPIAEDCGLIREITGVLLRRACRDARDWPAHITLSFNISPVELKDRTLGLRIMTILGETGLPAQRLEIEITESALVRDMAAAKDVLGSLREAGVRIALDDFGTGYSSLYHLRNFKLDKLKIDRSFIDAMMREPESATIVRALLGLGHGLGLTVTAEGVESGEQADALMASGCDQGQGFLFDKAMDATAAALLVEGKTKVGKRA